MSLSKIIAWFVTTILATVISARCYDPSPAFPLPGHEAYERSGALGTVLEAISLKINQEVLAPEFDISSFSVEVTTSKGTLWELHHTARDRDLERPGAVEVTGNSVYRMASVTKCFTTLAILQQHAAGNLSLDDTIDTYLSGLSGDIPWKDITLRTVASQLSGIIRECKAIPILSRVKLIITLSIVAQSDLLAFFPNPSQIGLPPMNKSVLPQCDVYLGFDRPCKKEGKLNDILSQHWLIIETRSVCRSCH